MAKRDIVQMNNGYETFDLKPQQKEMILELLYPTDSNPYRIEGGYKRILERVLSWGFYNGEDREALNYARECYLKNVKVGIVEKKRIY